MRRPRSAKSSAPASTGSEPDRRERVRRSVARPRSRGGRRRQAAGELDIVDIREQYEWDAGRARRRVTSRSSVSPRRRPTSTAHVPSPSCAAAGCAPAWSHRPSARSASTPTAWPGGFTAWHEQGLPTEPDGAVVADHCSDVDAPSAAHCQLGAADDLVADRLGMPGELLGRDALVSLRSDQHHLVAQLHVPVDDARELIHRDRRRHAGADDHERARRRGRWRAADSRPHTPPARRRRAADRSRSGAGRSRPIRPVPARAPRPRGSSSAVQAATRARRDRGRTATRRTARCRSARRRSACPRA